MNDDNSFPVPRFSSLDDSSFSMKLQSKLIRYDSFDDYRVAIIKD